jgi:hypothetical protein
MKSKAPKFYFNDKYTDYTTKLGGMALHKYHDEPKVGDTVRLMGHEASFLGLKISNFVVSKILPDPAIVRVIREKKQNDESLTLEEEEHEREVFGSTSSGQFDATTRFVVLKFSEHLSNSFVKDTLNKSDF